MPIFKFEDATIEVRNGGTIHITNDNKLRRTIETKGSVHVARLARTTYEHTFGKDFDQSELAVAIEILGHVYPDEMATKVLKKNVPQWVKNMMTEIKSHTDIIDIAESGTEASGWEILAEFTDLLIY